MALPRNRRPLRGAQDEPAPSAAGKPTATEDLARRSPETADDPAPKGGSATVEERTPAQPRARRGLPWYLSVPITLAAILAVFLAAARFDLLPGLPNPFAERQVDRSQPVLLKSIQDMSRYTGATGNFQVIIDLDNDAKFLPSALLGNRTLYVAAGTVGAYTDLGALGADAVTVSADRRSVTLRLPHAQLADTALDVKRSYVYSQQRGLFDRIGDFFSGNPGNLQQLEVLATGKIQTAAKDTALVATAETNTRTMFVGLLRSLGFTTVDVTVVG
ncbi:DUF4230 domain-containing protein [Kitasatospora sp. NBC_00240]|uniref:DUF4230 domain-containing protein n=1 Tax=Kitasatospora sp. NBC_00240 TaxID=2903567 RepID=UPI00225196BC|nr:DUF4230 domain-containing protein [Kitasatospora sp. NBC_00240]MCX5207966.1 DUF4230 domain-containing protein [Kitasatospora sp. NBC_00240]